MSSRPLGRVINYPEMPHCFKNMIRIGQFYIVVAGNKLYLRGENSKLWKESDAINAGIIAIKLVDSQRVLCASNSHELDILCLTLDGEIEKEQSKKLSERIMRVEQSAQAWREANILLMT